MERMRRKRSRASVAGLATLSAAFAFFVQLAPTLHALTPHEEHRSSCSHSSKSLHFEAALREERPECVVCAQLLGRQALLTPVRIRIDGELGAPAPLPTVHVFLSALLPDLPDSRGPPPAL